MNREETKRIIRIMCTTYPNYKPEDLSNTIDVWTMMLEEYSYQEISLALKAYIQTDTKGFAPSIGQIIDKVKRITEPDTLNELSAWALVSKAIRNGTYGAAEEFAKLPELVQMAVGDAENIRNWATSDYETIETVIASNFQRNYRNVVAKNNELRKFDENTKKVVIGINEHLKLKTLNLGEIQSDRPILEDKTDNNIDYELSEDVLRRLRERGVSV